MSEPQPLAVGCERTSKQRLLPLCGGEDLWRILLTGTPILDLLRWNVRIAMSKCPREFTLL